MNKWEDAEWVGSGKVQYKVNWGSVHHPQGSLLLQKVTGLVEAKSSQPVLWRAFQMLALLGQSHLLVS